MLAVAFASSSGNLSSWQDVLMVVPGTTTKKVVACFETGCLDMHVLRRFPVTVQSKTLTPLSSWQQLMEDLTAVWLVCCSTLARERMDVMFAVKELAIYMSAPTLCALQRLRKVIGYLKTSGGMGVKLVVPESGSWESGSQEVSKFWPVETFTDADWSANKQHRKSTSSAIHFVNRKFCLRFFKEPANCLLELQLRANFTAWCLVAQMESTSKGVWRSWQERRCSHSSMDRQQCIKAVGIQTGSWQGFRHLSGKVLWIQGKVLARATWQLARVPTEWNYSDIGTKPFTKNRLKIGAIDPSSGEMIGQEEFEAINSRMVGQQSLKRVAKAIFKMATLWGLESLAQSSAEATKITGDGMCLTCDQQQNTDSSETWWLWFTLGFMFLLWISFAVAAYMAWKRLSHDLHHCWNQVGDENAYIAQQAHRIDMMDARFYGLGERITENSNELSMTHDYVSGVHFAVVEGGGFLRNGLGLTNEQWIHLNTLERANMQASHSLGTPTYMQLVRQRAGAVGRAETTDAPGAHEGGESESPEEDREVDPTQERARYGQSVSETYEALKQEQRLCIIEGDRRDSSIIQNLMLAVLFASQNGLTVDTVGPLRQRVTNAFREMAEVARFQQRWDAADRYQAVEAIYSNSWDYGKIFTGMTFQIQSLEGIETAAKNQQKINSSAPMIECSMVQGGVRTIFIPSYCIGTSETDCTNLDEKCNKFSHVSTWKSCALPEAPFGWKETLPASQFQMS